MPELKPGLVGEFIYRVKEDMAAGHLSIGVLSTPSMISLMEISCHRTVEQYLEKGYTTVGTYVCVHHRAPVPVGVDVVVLARLLEVDQRKLVFRVEVRWGSRVIGEGEHHRFMVNEERFAAKLREDLIGGLDGR